MSALVERWKKSSLARVFFETLLIVVGVLLAFQLDRWYEAQQQATQVQDYLARLIVDVEEDMETLNYQSRTFERRSGYTKLLIEALENPSLVREDPRRYIVAVQQTGWRTNFFTNSYTFEELQNTGDLALLPLTIRRELYRYHHQNDHLNQFLPTVAGNQLEYYRRFAGLLDFDQVMLSGDPNLGDYVGSNLREITEQEAVQVFERFRKNKEAIAWLPWLMNTHYQAIRMNRRYQNSATALLDMLKQAQVGS